MGQNAAGRFHHAGMRPAAVVEPGPMPAGRFLCGVIHFAVIDAGEQNRARRGLPIAVADNHLGGAVAVIDVQLQDRAFGAEPLHAVGVPPFFIGIEPTVTEHEAQGVVAGLKQPAQIENIVQDPLAIVGLGRRQHLIADAAAVAVQLVIAQSADIDARAAHRFVDAKGFAQQRAASVHMHRVGKSGLLVLLLKKSTFRPRLCRRTAADPQGLPVRGLQQAHLPTGRRAPGGRPVLFIPYPHLPPPCLPRLQRPALIGYVGRMRCAHDSGIPQIGLFCTQLTLVRGCDDLKGGLAFVVAV